MSHIFRFFTTSASPWRQSAILFFVAFLVRWLHIVALGGSEFVDVPGLDGRIYLQLAEGVRQGAWPGDEPFFRPPLYSYFVYSVQFVFGNDSLAPIRIVQAFLGSTTCVLTYWLGRCAFRDPWVATVGAWICVLYGPAIAFDAQILPATLDGLFQTAFLTLLLIGQQLGEPSDSRSARSKRLAAWIAAGAIGGLASVLRGEAIVLVALGASWIAWVSRPQLSWGSIAQQLFAYGLPVVIAVGPVAFHNARHDEVPPKVAEGSAPDTGIGATLGRIARGQFSLVAGNGGINFYLGKHSAVGDRNDVNHPDHFATYGRAIRDARAASESASARSSWLVRQTLSDLAENPGAAAKRIGLDALRAINGAEVVRNSNLYASREDSWVTQLLLWKLGLAFPGGLLIPLALWGLITARPPRSASFLLGGRLVMWLVFALGFFVTARYRLPLLSILALYAAWGARDVWTRAFAAGSTSQQRVRVALVLGALIAAAHLPVVRVHRDRGIYELERLGFTLNQAQRPEAAERVYLRILDRNPDHVSTLSKLAIRRRQQGNLEDATAYLERALQIDPTYWIARNALGLTYYARGLYSQAERELREAIRIGDPDATVFSNLGSTLIQQGKADEALAAYREAVRIDPKHADSHYNIGAVLESQGDLSGARKSYESALEAQPKHGPARRKLDRLPRS